VLADQVISPRDENQETATSVFNATLMRRRYARLHFVGDETIRMRDEYHHCPANALRSSCGTE
jgi:hypothetical protein